MINHVRTLLLNCPAEELDDPGEEYVPEDFVPKKLSPAVAKVRVALFGPKPRRVKMNARVRQLMTLLHITELRQYVLAKDTRITYWGTGKKKPRSNVKLLDLPSTVEQIAATLSQADVKELFGATPAGPYAVFLDLWKGSDVLAYRLGGLLLAVAYRMDEPGAH